MTTEPKPLPVACQKCGQAIEYDEKLCGHCVGEYSGRRDYGRLPVDVFSNAILQPWQADVVALSLAYAAGRKRRHGQPSVPRNHE